MSFRGHELWIPIIKDHASVTRTSSRSQRMSACCPCFATWRDLKGREKRCTQSLCSARIQARSAWHALWAVTTEVSLGFMYFFIYLFLTFINLGCDAAEVRITWTATCPTDVSAGSELPFSAAHSC